jgi:hypothetical protein
MNSLFVSDEAHPSAITTQPVTGTGIENEFPGPEGSMYSTPSRITALLIAPLALVTN